MFCIFITYYPLIWHWLKILAIVSPIIHLIIYALSNERTLLKEKVVLWLDDMANKQRQCWFWYSYWSIFKISLLQFLGQFDRSTVSIGAPWNAAFAARSVDPDCLRQT